MNESIERHAEYLMQPGQSCDPLSHQNFAEAMGYQMSDDDYRQAIQLHQAGNSVKAFELLINASKEYWRAAADVESEEFISRNGG